MQFADRCLGNCIQWPSDSTAADKRDELAPPHLPLANRGYTLAARVPLCITANLTADWQLWVIHYRDDEVDLFGDVRYTPVSDRTPSSPRNDAMGQKPPHALQKSSRKSRILTFASLMTNSSALVLLIGGNEHVARAQSIMACSAGAPAINACDLKLDDALALLHYADLFVGTDSGPMNLAVAAATDAFALFGATPVLKYSKFIHAIVPEGGPCSGGMRQISPAMVLEHVEFATFRFAKNADKMQLELGESSYPSPLYDFSSIMSDPYTWLILCFRRARRSFVR